MSALRMAPLRRRAVRALPRHQLGPAPVEAAVVRLAVAIVAGDGGEIRVEPLAAAAHLVIQRMTAGDDAAPGLGAALPVVHVVLLEGAAGAEHAGAGEADRLL